MHICLSPGRETENLFGVALSISLLHCSSVEYYYSGVATIEATKAAASVKMLNNSLSFGTPDFPLN